MTDPTVCCIMLTRDRPAMARRAVECFRAQTYDSAKRMLLMLDSGDPFWYDRSSDSENEVHLGAQAYVGSTIGALRNIANEAVDAAVLLHWDSDDWSHPQRIAEQVALLQSSGADVVGYRELLFWRDPPGEAWLYTNNDPRYCCGTSLCYWRKTWERKPFKDLMRGEDAEFVKGLNSVGVVIDADHPRMIASIHGGNTCGYTAATLDRSINWRRAPELDEHCRLKMTLEVSA